MRMTQYEELLGPDSRVLQVGSIYVCSILVCVTMEMYGSDLSSKDYPNYSFVFRIIQSRIVPGILF